MSHTKNDFKYHKKFDNKYIDQTYYAYLYRNKIDFLPRGIDDNIRSVNFIPYHAILINEFIICCNNDIARRGSLKTAKERIKEEFEYIKTRKYFLSLKTRYGYYDGAKYGLLNEIAELLDNCSDKNDVQIKELNLIKSVYDWSEKFQDDFYGFMDFIYDEVTYFDKNHYDWIKDGDIIYDRSLKDNEKKRVYCVINGDKGNEKFKNIYFDRVSIEPKYKGKLYKQISYMFVNIADINNLFVSKKYDKAKELLNDYVNDNMNMNSCYDIYYRKVFENICNIAKEYNTNNNSTITFKEIQKLIIKENEKYKDDIVLFKEVVIDLTKNEYSFIKEI